MALDKLYLPVDASGYGVRFGENNISVKLQGGASRFRKDILGATHEIPAQWTLGRVEYDYIQAFYRTTIKEGSLPFLIDLVVGSNAPVEHTAHIMPGTFELRSQSGDTYIVAATLEVIAKEIDEEADQDIIDAYLTLIGEGA